jgi:hypothetical protein
MLLYLDTRDLINILERSEPVPGETLLNLLRSGGHRLAVSFALVAELAAPLQYPHAKTNVMRLLNRLGELPVVFIADLRLEFLELKEALESWGAGRECQVIDPFVPRIDYTLPLDGPPATHLQLTSSISETVFQLWSEAPEIFNGHKQHLDLLMRTVNQDRTLPTLPKLRDHFPVVLRKRLTDFELHHPSDFGSFSDWLYEKPARCPSALLGLEIYRVIVQNLAYVPEASLFEDYSHVKSLPYVDVLTLDKHMAECVRQACNATGLSYHAKVYTKAKEAIKCLE